MSISTGFEFNNTLAVSYNKGTYVRHISGEPRHLQTHGENEIHTNVQCMHADISTYLHVSLY